MNLFFDCSQALKCPLYTTTRGAMGEWMMRGVELRPSTCFQRIWSVASVSLHLIGMVFSMPLWVVGEALEICTKKGRALFNDEVDLADQDLETITLHPEMTECMGTAVSTFQATSNPNFCKGSALHDSLKDPTLGLGGGVDILTPEGAKQTADRLEQMGSNAFRFSVEWADVKKNGLNRYTTSARYFHDRGFKVMITLDHWMGDGSVDIFEKPGDHEAFVSYATDVYLALRPYASKFLTFNEPNVDANQKYVMGDLPPKKVGRFWSSMQLSVLKLKAHRAVYDRFQKLEESYRGPKNSDPLQVGLSHQAIWMVAASRWNIIARVVAFVITHTFHESFMRIAGQPEMKRTLDFLGVQFYAQPKAGRNGWQIVDSIATPTKQNPNAWMVKGMKYRFNPEGILPVLQSIHDRLHIPIMVTETGSAGEINPQVQSRALRKPDSHLNHYYDASSNIVMPPAAITLDRKSVDYSREMEMRKATYYRYSLLAIRKAQDLGIRVTGVFLWTLFDNLEWQHGYTPGCAFGILARSRTSGIVRITEGFETIRRIFTQTRISQERLVKETVA